jgi:hypothetical protein
MECETILIGPEIESLTTATPENVDMSKYSFQPSSLANASPIYTDLVLVTESSSSTDIEFQLQPSSQTKESDTMLVEPVVESLAPARPENADISDIDCRQPPIQTEESHVKKNEISVTERCNDNKLQPPDKTEESKTMTTSPVVLGQRSSKRMARASETNVFPKSDTTSRKSARVSKRAETKSICKEPLPTDGSHFNIDSVLLSLERKRTQIREKRNTWHHWQKICE